MRHRITIIAACLLLTALNVFGQMSSTNYVKTTVMLDSVANGKSITIQYYDDYGRPRLKASQSTGNGYIFSDTDYDICGREYRHWLPFPQSVQPYISSYDDYIDAARDFYQDANRYTERVSQYNKNGSPTALERYGKLDNGTFGKVDDLTLMHEGNQLIQVADAAPGLHYNGAFDFRDGASLQQEYTYDGCGSLTSDANKGIAWIDYDLTGMPRRIQFSNGNVTEYVYSVSGEKLRTIHRTAMPDITVPIGSTLELMAAATLSVDSTDYIGSMLLKNGQPDRYLFPGGYCTYPQNATAASQPVFHYYTQDHLGNNRTVVNEDGTLEQVTHYYPFGGIFGDATLNAGTQPHKYNGKEFDHTHGLDRYDYGARNYDAALLQWTSVDPLAAKYYNISPYAYCHNNPMIMIDPDGKDDYYTSDGQFIFRDPQKTDNIIIRNQFLYDLKSMTGAEWINPDIPLTNANISPSAYSTIFTDILKRNGFDTNMLKNGKISIVKLKENTYGDGPQYEADGFYNHDTIIPYNDADIARNKRVYDNYEITAYIHPIGDENREFLSTVSNVISVLGIHEFYGHGLLGIKGNQHWRILQLQRKHSSWKSVSPLLKTLYRYLETNKIDNYNKR